MSLASLIFALITSISILAETVRCVAVHALGGCSIVRVQVLVGYTSRGRDEAYNQTQVYPHIHLALRFSRGRLPLINLPFPCYATLPVSFRLPIKQVASRVVLRGSTINSTSHYALSGRTPSMLSPARHRPSRQRGPRPWPRRPPRASGSRAASISALCIRRVSRRAEKIPREQPPSTNRSLSPRCRPRSRSGWPGSRAGSSQRSSSS